MIRRILFAGSGGLAGFGIWYAMCSTKLGQQILLPMLHRGDVGFSDFIGPRLGLASLATCVGGCGWIVIALGEKLRIMPTQEELDEAGKPVSLFSDRT